MPYAILKEDNELVGYFCVGLRDIGEMTLVRTELFAAVIKSYMDQFGITNMYLGLPAYHPLISQALAYADGYQIMQPGNFKVLNFKRVVESFMREKNKHEYLSDGRITLESDIFGKWCIEKSGNLVEVNSYQGEVQFELPGYTVYPFLFGTYIPQYVTQNKEEEILLKSWFPLPLYCPHLS